MHLHSLCYREMLTSAQKSYYSWISLPYFTKFMQQIKEEMHFQVYVSKTYNTVQKNFDFFFL